MRGLCPIIKDMARAVNLANNDKEAMEKIIAIDKKAIVQIHKEKNSETIER